MLSSSLFVLNCCLSMFGSITIPVDGVKVDKFGPSSFLWLEIQNLLNFNKPQPSKSKTHSTSTKNPNHKTTKIKIKIKISNQSKKN